MAKYKDILYGTVFPDGNLTGFPKLFKITTDADIAAELSGGGGIELYGPDGTTPVPFGLYPSTDLPNGTILMRVKLDPLTAAMTGDVMARLRYGSGLTTTEDKAGTVSNSYVLFTPMEEDPSGSSPQMFDWVSESFIGTSVGTMTSGDLVAGQVGNNLDFDGTDDAISFGDYSAFDEPAGGTVEIIVKNDVSTPVVDTQTGLASVGYPGSNRSHYPYTDGNLYLGLLQNAERPISGYSDSGFDKTARHAFAITATSGANNYILYRNGSVVTTATAATNIYFGTPTVGRSDVTYFHDGQQDEFRLSDVVRSPDWLGYTYEDDFNNADTFSLDTEVTEGGGGFATTAASLPSGLNSIGVGLTKAMYPSGLSSV